MTSTYKGSYVGIGRMLQRPGMARKVIAVARDMKPIAEALSPTGEPPEDPHPGLYRRSFQIHYGVKNVPFRGKPLLRPFGRLINVAKHALAVEHGNAHVQRHAVLRKTLDAAKAAAHVN